MYTPHTITVYNVIHETDVETFEETDNVYITVLSGVFVDASKAVNVNKSGLEGADAVDVYIPFSVSAKSPQGAVKQYAKPMEFWAADDRSGLWTLSVEGNGGETFFIKGNVVLNNLDAARAHDDCYNVTKVDERDFGSVAMRHWQVGGK